MAKLRIQRGEPNVRVPRVLLLDGDIVTGSLAMRLTGKVEPSIHTLMLYLDDRELEGFAGHDRWPNVYDDAPPGEKAMRDFVMWPEILPNLNLLAAPDEPDLFFDFGPKEYREVLQLLSRFYDVIIIDSGTEIIMESNRAWLAHANEVFLVTAPEVDRLHNAYKAARYIATARPHPQATDEQLEKLPPLVTADKLSLVMTKYDIDSGLDDIDDVINKIFPWLIDRPQQRFYVPDFSREMVRINNSNGQRFLVHENQVFAKVIGKMAKHMFSRYQLQRQRTLPPQG
jgi:MinD-like ATPase involved in chromosome partitioning or flagellar assembly